MIYLNLFSHINILEKFIKITYDLLYKLILAYFNRFHK